MAANVSNSTLTTNFNVSPYYDDYDENNQYYRILYKPGYAVQSRELTQSQTLLQKQIHRFGRHIFKEGSLVLEDDENRSKFSLAEISYVKVKDSDTTNNSVILSDYVDKTITGLTSNISAIVIDAVDGIETSQNTKTLYVAYLNGNPTANLSTFANNEVLISNNLPSITTLSTNSVGKGTRFKINSGVLFAKEHFISFPTQAIIAERYSTKANCQIGFNLTEQIVSYQNDGTLLDPALESSNYSAPGADRFKLTANLVRYDINEQVSDPNFVRLISLENGITQTLQQRTQYSAILNEFAKRTYDESGDYYSYGMNVKIRENLNTGNNFGYLTLSEGGDPDKLTVVIEPGVSYVQGFEVNKIIPTYLTIDKATDFVNVNNQIITTRLGNYFICDEAVGPLIHDQAIPIYLYDTPQNRISERKWSSSSQTGNIVGTARLASAVYERGTLGTANSQIIVYLFDINMIGSNTISSNVKNIYSNSGSILFSADIVLNSSNNAVLEDTSTGSMLYYTGSNYTRKIRDNTDNPDTSFLFKKTTTTTGTGTFTISSAGGENFPYAAGILSDAEKREFLICMTTSTNVALSGVVSNTSNTQLAGSSTSFNNLNIGDKIKFTNTDIGIYTITSIIDSGNVTITPSLTNSVVSNGIVKVYNSGDLIDFTTKGATGVEKSITAISNTQISFDMKETLSNTASFTIIYNATRSSAKEATKTLKVDRYVQINCASAGVTGPFNLGVSDLYKITDIRVHTSPFVNSTDGTRVLGDFTVDGGQKDYLVDHAKITPVSSRITLTSSSYILVKLDYFDHDYSLGKGYFSVDSYPINDSNPSSTQIKTEDIPIFSSKTTGQVYDLRNYLDFRPIKTNTASDSTTIAGATTNPSDTNTFKSDGSGLRLPAPSEQITFDFSYYLSRRDLITLNKDGKFNWRRGVPSSNPIIPNSIDNAMVLATLSITPYPSLGFDYALKLKRGDIACAVQKTAHRRFTMRDIGVLKERIDNLEYYASLNALEKATTEMQILDENGLNRFKNGIFVEPFNNHDLGAIGNPDYKISIDKTEKSMTSIFNQESLYYNVYSNNEYIFANTEVGIATLKYDEVSYINQPFATTDRNIETSVFNYTGILKLSPQTDVWVDTTVLPPNVINSYVTNQGTTQYSGSWKKVVTGYKIVNNATGAIVRRYDPNKSYTIYGTRPNAENDPAVGLGFWTGAYWDNYWQSWGGQNVIVPRFKVGQVVSAKDFARFEAFLLAGPDGKNFVSWYSGPNISVRVEEETSSILEGVSGSSSTEMLENNIGNFVTDTSLITYIRPQYVLIEAKGLLPTTKHYVYFDGENMSSYVTPLTYQEYLAEYSIKNSGATIPTNLSPVFSKNKGDDLISSSAGILYATLQIPNTSEKRFTNGNKLVILTDSRTNADNPSSSAVTNFYASGLNVTQQGLIQSTAITTIYPPLPTLTGSATNTLVESFTRTYSCLAYSFFVNAPDGEEGVFLTSADVFFSSKDATNGVWFEVREIDNGGSITRNQIPYSEVWYDSADVPTSNDSSVPLNVKFKAPIYLKNGQQYAFVVHTVGINPGYRIYVADINAQTLGQPSPTPKNIDLLTGQQYTTRKVTGTLYTTNNNLNWDIVDGVDLKVKFYRAKFVTNVNGVITLGNKPIELFKANNIGNKPSIGEIIRGNDKLTLSAITGGTISVGDYLIGSNSGANTTVLSISGSLYKMSNTGFKVNETVTAYYASNLNSKGVTANIASVVVPVGTVYRFDENYLDTRVRIVNSNGNFEANDKITGVITNSQFNIESFDRLRYSIVNFEPQYLLFGTTQMTFEMKTISNTGVVQLFTPIDEKNDWYIGDERALYSRSDEISLFSNEPSNQVKATLRTISEYQSPVLDLNRTHTIYIDNIINNDITGESNTSGGNLINTYISKIITLAEKQDAEDLNIILTAYRPPGSEIYVWAKILNSQDFDPFESKKWIRLEYINKSDVYSSLSNRDDFIEYGFKFPDSVMTGLDSVGDPKIIEYTRDDGQKFSTFKNFAIKIGLGADNSGIVPRVTDLRAIALQL